MHSFPHLTQAEITQIKTFLLLCQPIELTSDVIEKTIAIRREYRFKTPDAIIAASALSLNIPLVSADTDFEKAVGLALVSDILS